MHALALFDTGFEGPESDLDPGEVPWTHLPRRPGVDLRYALALRRHAKVFRADILHAHNDTAVFHAGLAALVPGPRRFRVIGTFHTWPAAPTGWGRRATRAASLGVARCTAVSAELARSLVAEGWVSRCEVIRNGVNLTAFAPRSPDARWRALLEARGHRSVVGCIARLTPVKGHAHLLAAAEILRTTCPGLL
ncbi:MAG: glycosyltransferase, partial [Alphaproteobacteria bacterium]|nr:glycosyltransferase [Alphaproteobacteria bacterium]MDX5370092.1 glycosyltransferase [Alphaproteobacteria bacterium]MDX5464667.1 glycosyltransferase [Alphaproteobacteria bacterium]